MVDVSKPNDPLLIASHSFSYPIVAMAKLSELLVVATRSLMVVNPQTGSILAEDSILSSSLVLQRGSPNICVKSKSIGIVGLVDLELNLLDSVGFLRQNTYKACYKESFCCEQGCLYINGLEIENVPKFREQERGGFLTYNIANQA